MTKWAKILFLGMGSLLLLLSATSLAGEKPPAEPAEPKALTSEEVGHKLMAAGEKAAVVGAMQCDAPHDFVENPNLRVLMISAENEVVPGSTLHVALRFQMAEGWHLYYGKNSGGIGLPTKVKWKLPEGLEAAPIRWPAPMNYKEPTGTLSFVYEDELVLFSELKIPKDLPIGQPIELGATINYQLCSNKCIRGKAKLNLKLPVVAKATPIIGSPWCKTLAAAYATVPVDKLEGYKVSAAIAQSPLRPGDEALAVVAIEAEEGHKLSKPKDPHHPALAFDADDRLEMETLALEPYGDNGFRVISRIKVPEDIAEFYEYGAAEIQLGGLLRATVDPNETRTDGDTGFRFSLPISFGEAGAEIKETTESPLFEAITNQSATNSNAKTTSEATPPASTPISIWYALLLAFIGGLILNIMPCVLPVLSLKALALVEEAGESKHSVKAFVGVYALGVLASFWALAGVTIALKFSGELVGWGFQFQQPAFVLVMAAVIFAFSLSLFGVFEIPGMTVSGKSTGLKGSFVHGILTTALSTPCSAPFLGSALTFALSQSPAMILLIFSVIGLGLATPIAIITLSPSTRRFIPKPGAWMETFKQFIAFLLVGTVIYLLMILNEQLVTDAMSSVFIFFGFLSFAVWVLGRFAGPMVFGPKKWIALLMALGITLGGSMLVSLEQIDPLAVEKDLSTEHIDWQVFRGQETIDLANEGKTLLIDFTAEWCPTCKANEAASIETDAVSEKLKEMNVLSFKADLTQSNPVASEWVQKFGRVAIPLVVVIPAGKVDQTIIMPEVFTEGELLDALDKAGPSKNE